MNLLFYIPEVEGIGEEMIELAEKFKTAFSVDIYHVFRRLNLRFRRPVEGEVVTVLFLSHCGHLQEILSIAPLLERSRVVVLLPDHTPETIAQGHLLRPRFLTFVDSPLEELVAVLNKIGTDFRKAANG